MNKEYKQSNPIIVNDSEKGLVEREYQDNIEEVLKLENEIEYLNTKIKELEEYDYPSSIIYKIFTKLAPLFPPLFCLIYFGSATYSAYLMQLSMPPRIVCLVIIEIASFVLSSKINKKISKNQNEKEAMKMQKGILKTILGQKQSKLREITARKTKNNQPTDEIRDLKPEIAQLREMLTKQLNFLIEYVTYQKQYQESYQNNTLEQDIKDSEQLELVRQLIETDLSK